MKIVLSQQVVSADLSSNLSQIQAQIHLAEPGDWLVFPEGMLSGYFPVDPHYIGKLNAEKILGAINEIQAQCDSRGCHCLFGTAYPCDNLWFNTTVFISPGQQPLFVKYPKSEDSCLRRVEPHRQPVAS